jgi:hypothetical protein
MALWLGAQTTAGGRRALQAGNFAIFENGGKEKERLKSQTVAPSSIHQPADR